MIQNSYSAVGNDCTGRAQYKTDKCGPESDVAADHGLFVHIPKLRSATKSGMSVGIILKSSHYLVLYLEVSMGQ